jgi:hypothetical protein
VRRLRPKPFVENDDHLLWLALTARNSGCRASELLNLSSEVVALDFDLTCTLRLMAWDNEREMERFKALGQMLGAGE